MDEDIPAEYYEQIAREQAESVPAGGGGAAPQAGIRICPHCTFENMHSGTDCEICVLPLQ